MLRVHKGELPNGIADHLSWAGSCGREAGQGEAGLRDAGPDQGRGAARGQGSQLLEPEDPCGDSASVPERLWVLDTDYRAW